MRALPLKGIRVVEFEGLAPTVFCGMILADFGADVIIVNRLSAGSLGADTHLTFLNRGKRSIAVDLKNSLHRQMVKELLIKADVVIDSFRPGKLENVGLGPSDFEASNPSLIFARLTGFGQEGSLKDQAGHDINYLSYSGILSTFGDNNSHPLPPNNMLADFGGGGAFGVIGILMALFERSKTGKGQVVDISMTDSVAYMSSFLLNMKKNGEYSLSRGSNLFDGSKAPFYRTYKCNDGKFIAVGCLEEEFYQRFLRGLDVQPSVKNRFDPKNYDLLSTIFTDKIKEKSRDEWMRIFLPLDCCVSPVLEFEELTTNQISQKFINHDERQNDSKFPYTFSPQPRLPNHIQAQTLIQSKELPRRGQHSAEILKQIGIPEKRIEEFLSFQQNHPKL